MSKPGSILTAETDKAHFVAQGILCGLAAVCSVGVIWAVGHNPSDRMIRRPVSQDTTVSAAGSVPLPEAASFIPPSTISTTAPASIPSPSPISSLSTTPVIPTPSPLSPPAPPPVSPGPGLLDSVTGKPSLPPAFQLSNPQIIEAVEAARQVRKLGDNATALESLRSADLREPNHPEIIGEMAITYEAMGLVAKARDAWRTVLAMGEGKAGGYYVLAQSKLEGVAPDLNNTSNIVSLGECQIIREPAPNNLGEKVTVRVPIIATPGAVIDPSQMDIHVFLFEQVNDGERIEQVRAEAPTQNWINLPVDWADPAGETVDITYNLAAPKPEEIRDLGRRSFHGYLVKLFYQNKLAGEQAQPDTLKEFPPRNGPAGLDNALFPK